MTLIVVKSAAIMIFLTQWLNFEILEAQIVVIYRAGPRHVGAPGRLKIWHLLKPIFS